MGEWDDQILTPECERGQTRRSDRFYNLGSDRNNEKHWISQEHTCVSLSDAELLALTVATGSWREVPEVRALVEAGDAMLAEHGYYAEATIAPEPVPCECDGCMAMRVAVAPFREVCPPGCEQEKEEIDAG